MISPPQDRRDPEGQVRSKVIISRVLRRTCVPLYTVVIVVSAGLQLQVDAETCVTPLSWCVSISYKKNS